MTTDQKGTNGNNCDCDGTCGDDCQCGGHPLNVVSEGKSEVQNHFFDAVGSKSNTGNVPCHYEEVETFTGVLVKIPKKNPLYPSSGMQYVPEREIEVMNEAGQIETVIVPAHLHCGQKLEKRDGIALIANREFYGPITVKMLGTEQVFTVKVIRKIIPAHEVNDKKVEARIYTMLDYHLDPEGTKPLRTVKILKLVTKDNLPTDEDIPIGWSHYICEREYLTYEYKCGDCGAEFTMRSQLKGDKAENPLCTHCRPTPEAREKRVQARNKEEVVTHQPMKNSLVAKVAAALAEQKAKKQAAAQDWQANKDAKAATAKAERQAREEQARQSTK
jgi:hypothetical protein